MNDKHEEPNSWKHHLVKNYIFTHQTNTNYCIVCRFGQVAKQENKTVINMASEMLIKILC